MTYEFNSRSTYIDARAQWKTDYLELSSQIRRAKLAFKEAAREASATHIPSRESSSEVQKAYYGAIGTVGVARRAKAALRTSARKHLELLAKMKKEAANQWAIEHATVN